MGFFIPFWGYMADRWGRAHIFAMGATLSALSAFPSFALMHNHPDNIWLVWVAIGVPFGIFHAGVFAGGLTPPILAKLFSNMFGGRPWLICAYVLIIGLTSAACALYLWRQTHGAGRVAVTNSVLIK